MISVRCIRVTRRQCPYTYRTNAAYTNNDGLLMRRPFCRIITTTMSTRIQPIPLATATATTAIQLFAPTRTITATTATTISRRRGIGYVPSTKSYTTTTTLLPTRRIIVDKYYYNSRNNNDQCTMKMLLQLNDNRYFSSNGRQDMNSSNQKDDNNYRNDTSNDEQKLLAGQNEMINRKEEQKEQQSTKQGKLSGWFDRYVQFRMDMSKIYSFTSDSTEFYPPVQLFDFTRHSDSIDAQISVERIRELESIKYNGDSETEQQQQRSWAGFKDWLRQEYTLGDRWTLSDDSVIGGYSTCGLEFIKNPEDHDYDYGYVDDDSESSNSNSNNNNNSNNSNVNDNNKKEITRSSEHNDNAANVEPEQSTAMMIKNDIEDQLEQQQLEQQQRQRKKFVPFLRWYGNIDTTVGIQNEEGVQRSGFASICSPDYTDLFGDGANLRKMYNAIEIVCRASSTLPKSMVLVEEEGIVTSASDTVAIANGTTTTTDDSTDTRTSTVQEEESNELVEWDDDDEDEEVEYDEHRTFSVILEVSTATPNKLYEATIRPSEMLQLIRDNNEMVNDDNEDYYSTPPIVFNNTNTNNIDDTSNNSVSNYNDTSPIDYSQYHVDDIDDSPFLQIIIPINDFTQVSGKYAQNPLAIYEYDDAFALSDNVKIESINITLKDRIDGPFVFDLTRIRAININNINKIRGGYFATSKAAYNPYTNRFNDGITVYDPDNATDDQFDNINNTWIVTTNSQNIFSQRRLRRHRARPMQF